MNEDIKTIHNELSSLNQHKGETDEELAQEYYDKYLERNDSMITKLMAGQIKTVTTCKVCATPLTVFNPFMILYLPIYANNHSKTSLDQCFKDFCRNEELNQGNFDCAECQTETQALKTTDIYNGGDILVIGLKRFEDDMSGRKKENFVEFPFNLSMEMHFVESKFNDDYLQMRNIQAHISFME